MLNSRQKFRDLHLFEFMDLPWLPQSLRQTLVDALEVINSRPFRFYYDFVVSEIWQMVERCGITQVVELGAGSAPLAQRIARDPRFANIPVIVSDLNPNVEYFKSLESQFPRRVKGHLRSVNFLERQEWPSGTLVVLSSTFHHLPAQSRRDVIERLTADGTPFVMAEAVRHNLVSFLGCLFFGGIVTMLVPLLLLGRSGRLRRLLWCWAVPLAPILFTWDGIASVWRCWSEREWKAEFHKLTGETVEIRTSLLSFVLKRQSRLDARRVAAG